MDINFLINKIIENNLDKSIKEIESCCGVLNFNVPVNIIETDKVKVIYRDNGECEIERKKNSNPVIYRDKNQKIYRRHGEWEYIKYEMYILAGLNKEAELLLKDNYKFD